MYVFITFHIYVEIGTYRDIEKMINQIGKNVNNQ